MPLLQLCMKLSFSFSILSVAIDALKQFLKVSGSENILERLESNGVWPLMEKEDTCPHAMLHLARYTLAPTTHQKHTTLHETCFWPTCRLLSSSYPDEVSKTVDCLSPSLTGIYDAHRITVVSFYSEVICCSLGYSTCEWTLILRLQR